MNASSSASEEANIVSDEAKAERAALSPEASSRVVIGDADHSNVPEDKKRIWDGINRLRAELREVNDIYLRIDSELAIEHERADRLLRLYNL